VEEILAEAIPGGLKKAAQATDEQECMADLATSR